jgi:hypothetical protein
MIITIAKVKVGTDTPLIIETEPLEFPEGTPIPDAIKKAADTCKEKTAKLEDNNFKYIVQQVG